MARDAAGAALGRLADPSRILAIGDGLVTDIAGANRERLDALFIASGIHGRELIDHAGALGLDVAERLLADKGLAADHVATQLSW
jgi:ribonucleotide monophosphatase NagD (HAD superfamily)